VQNPANPIQHMAELHRIEEKIDHDRDGHSRQKPVAHSDQSEYIALPSISRRSAESDSEDRSGD
jgi:hypothetical protein